MHTLPAETAAGVCALREGEKEQSARQEAIHQNAARHRVNQARKGNSQATTKDKEKEQWNQWKKCWTSFRTQIAWSTGTC